MSNLRAPCIVEMMYSHELSVQNWFVATPSLIAQRQKATRKRKNEAIKGTPALRAQKPTTRVSTSKSALPSDSESVEVLQVGGSGWEEVEVDDDIYSEDSKGDQEAEANNPSDIDDDQPEEPPPSKKQRRPEPLESLTAYIDIISPPRTQRAKETSEARGPFFFTTKTPHREFLQSIASCAVDANFSPLISSINQNRLQWKLNTPANDKKKPLSSESGYKALIVKLVSQIEKGRDTTITVFMPPMLKVRQDVSHCQPVHLVLNSLIVSYHPRRVWIMLDSKGIPKMRSSPMDLWVRQFGNKRSTLYIADIHYLQP